MTATIEDSSKSGHRIPAALQDVFIASNRGFEVNEPPANGEGCKVFLFEEETEEVEKPTSKGNHRVFVRQWLFQRKRASHKKKTTPLKKDSPSDPQTMRKAAMRTARSRSRSISRSSASSRSVSSGRRRRKESTETTLESSPKTVKTVLDPDHTMDTISVSSPGSKTEASKDDASKEPEAIRSSTCIKDFVPERSSTVGSHLQSPQAFLDIMMKARSLSTKKYSALECAFFNKPTPLQLISYQQELIELVKTPGGERMLQSILPCGISTNPCNSHGESLVHLCCRQANYLALQVMLECGATLLVCDVMGRTPLHDACWRTKSCFKTIDLILSQDPTLLLMQDARGNTPLSYVPKHQWGIWRDYLYDKRDDYFPQRHPRIDGPSPIPPLTQLLPNSRPVPDPENALSVELAEKVASRQLPPREAQAKMKDLPTRSSNSSRMSIELTSRYESVNSGSRFSSLESSSRYNSDDEDETSVCSDLELEAVALAVSACKRAVDEAPVVEEALAETLAKDHPSTYQTLNDALGMSFEVGVMESVMEDALAETLGDQGGSQSSLCRGKHFEDHAGEASVPVGAVDKRGPQSVLYHTGDDAHGIHFAEHMGEASVAREEEIAEPIDSPEGSMLYHVGSDAQAIHFDSFDDSSSHANDNCSNHLYMNNINGLRSWLANELNELEAADAEADA